MTKTGRTPISIMILTHQSERTLGDVLEAVKSFDDLVVVDSGSTDRTLEIASSFGARVFQRKLDGFGAQKQFGVDQALHDWVMIVDSDEVLSKGLIQEIQEIGTRITPQVGAFSVPRRLLFLGRLMRFAGTQDEPVRLLHKARARVSEHLVHERVETQAQVGRLTNWIEHHSYLTLEDYFQKFNRYTSLAAQEYRKEGRSRSLWLASLQFPLQFVQRYILKLGFLDGVEGLLWSLFSAIYPVVKWAKVRRG